MATNGPIQEDVFRATYLISREWLETLSNADLGALHNCMRALFSDVCVFRLPIPGQTPLLILSLEAGPLYVYASESIDYVP